MCPDEELYNFTADSQPIWTGKSCKKEQAWAGTAATRRQAEAGRGQVEIFRVSGGVAVYVVEHLAGSPLDDEEAVLAD